MLTTPLKLIRYLIELRMNRGLVWLFRDRERELARRWGERMAAQMPIVQARPWRKALARRGEDGSAIWPVEAALRFQSAKRSFGRGEPLFVEVKLFGDAADHGFFMETMLPALERLGCEPETAAEKSVANPLWGHFEIRSVYSARGHGWKPLIRDGRIDLRFKVNAGQWEQGLRSTEYRSEPATRLAWLTPYRSGDAGKNGTEPPPPSLRELVEETARRLGRILHGRWTDPREFVGKMDADCARRWNRALEAASAIRQGTPRQIPVRPSGGPAFFGEQRFEPEIPPELFSVLALGHLVQLGQGTLYGNGLFRLC